MPINIAFAPLMPGMPIDIPTRYNLCGTYFWPVLKYFPGEERAKGQIEALRIIAGL